MYAGEHVPNMAVCDGGLGLVHVLYATIRGKLRNVCALSDSAWGGRRSLFPPTRDARAYQPASSPCERIALDYHIPSRMDVDGCEERDTVGVGVLSNHGSLLPSASKSGAFLSPGTSSPSFFASISRPIALLRSHQELFLRKEPNASSRVATCTMCTLLPAFPVKFSRPLESAVYMCKESERGGLHISSRIHSKSRAFGRPRLYCMDQGILVTSFRSPLLANLPLPRPSDFQDIPVLAYTDQ